MKTTNNTSVKIKERKPWVDALRAIAIVMVIYGHSAKGFTEYYIFTSPIKMPLFFAISGYVFSMHNGNQRVFWTNWFKKLIIPWFCLALIPYFPKLFVNPRGIISYLYDLISGKSLWFMPCFVVSEAIHFYIRKLAKTEWVVIVSSIIAFVFGLLAHKMGILNFGMINRAFVVQLYFLLGYVFRMHEDWFVRQSWFIMSIGIVFYLGLGILSYFVFPNRSLDVHMNEYYNLPLCITMIVLGNLLLFSVFNKANIKNRVLEFLGQNTLLYYVWHGYAIAFLSLVLSYCDITLEINWWTAIIKTFWACLVCGVCAMIVNKYLPWVVGKKRIIKNG